VIRFALKNFRGIEQISHLGHGSYPMTVWRRGDGLGGGDMPRPKKSFNFNNGLFGLVV
jgi:hypothetical protein